MFLLFVLLFRVSLLHDVWCNLRAIWASFWCRFGVVLMSFWCPWVSFGDPGRPKGPPREPSRKSNEKVSSWVLCGPSAGTPFEPKSVTNRKQIIAKTALKNIVRKVLHKRSPGNPSNHENDGFAYTKPLFSNLNLYIQIDWKLSPMGTPLGTFWVVLETLG